MGAVVHLVDANAALARCTAEEIAAECGVRTVVHEADVRDFARADDILTAAGDVYVLVNNAGIARDAMSWRMTESEWDDVIAVDLKGVFNYARAAAAVFRRTRAGGRIVSVSSINGLRGRAGLLNYAAAKAGIVGLTKTLARELGRYGVTVNAVAPGYVRTPLTAHLAPEIVEAARAESVLGRLGEPDDVAALIAFLCSDRASWITGEVIRVDGGQAM